MLMWKSVSLAAVSPVTNGLGVVSMSAECPKPAKLAAVKRLTSLY